MKRFVIILTFISMFLACNESPHPLTKCACQKVLRVRDRNHATRAFVDVQCQDGSVLELNAHQSHTISCKENTIFVNDYTTGRKHFGDVK